MRITTEHTLVFKKALDQIFGSIAYELYLYGSRTQDHLKGGDIDLLILTNEEGLQVFKRKHLDILVQIKKNKNVGDRRIDIKACEQKDLDSDPFLKTIKDTLVKI